MAFQPFPYSGSHAAQADRRRHPAEREMMGPESRPRHKPTYSISEGSRVPTPVLNTSTSFPSLRAASAMSLRSQTQNQGKLSGLASATKQRVRGVWNRRRPVKDVLMDSPTIPGFPPFPLSSQHERNPSAGYNWRQNVFGEAILSGIEPPAFMMQRLGDTTPLDAGSEKAISPLHLLSYNRSPITPVESIDAPPKVPPKGVKDIPRPYHCTNHTMRRVRSNATLKTGVPPPTSPALETMKPRETLVSRKKTSNEIIAERMARALAMEKPQNPTSRQRAHTAPSQASGLSNRLPKLQIDITMSPSPPQNEGEGVPQKSKRKGSSTTDIILPSGIRPSRAVSQYSVIDMEVLRQAAKIQAESYDVLKPEDVRFLQTELGQLESRCQHLKETQKSLRAGRKTLQFRMLTYLRSSRSCVFSHESLLKQEEALAELDEAIDDQDRKIEKVEERRLQVSRKLLEHAAAVLSVCSDHTLPLKVIATPPPRTPERPKKPREEIESITVYALFADIEQELGRMLSYPP